MPADPSPWFLQLEEEDQQFVKRLVLASGSLKELAEGYDVSYPTIRLRLDRLIERIRSSEDPLSDPSRRRSVSWLLKAMSPPRSESSCFESQGNKERRKQMNEGWFSAGFSRNLVWFSLLSVLSVLSVYVERGRHRTLVLSVWTAAFALGVACLGACAVGLAVGQPSHVFRPLLHCRRGRDRGFWRYI